MSAITHFFGEDIGKISLPGDVFDRKRLVLNPLANRVFTKFNVASRLGGHIVRPSNTSLVVVE